MSKVLDDAVTGLVAVFAAVGAAIVFIVLTFGPLFLAAYVLMLLVALAHATVLPAVPAIGYWAAMLAVLAVRAAVWLIKFLVK